MTAATADLAPLDNTRRLTLEDALDAGLELALQILVATRARIVVEAPADIIPHRASAVHHRALADQQAAAGRLAIGIPTARQGLPGWAATDLALWHALETNWVGRGRARRALEDVPAALANFSSTTSTLRIGVTTPTSFGHTPFLHTHAR